MTRNLRLFVLLFCVLPCMVHAQYAESFSVPNKGYLLNNVNDFSGVNWTLSSWSADNTSGSLGGRDATDFFNTTAAGKLECIDLDHEVYWESPLLNIGSAGTVSFAMDLTWAGFDQDVLANSCTSGPYGTNATIDVIKVLYSINGGSYTMIPNKVGGASCATIGYASGQTGANGSTTITQPGIAGSTLRIRIIVNTNANAELVTIDNVSVPQAGVTIFGACSQSTFTGAPAEVVITNSTCGTGCTVSGGRIAAPAGTPCPSGTVLQYQVNGGSWTTTLPVYAQTGPAQTIKTRCACEDNNSIASTPSAGVTTVPGVCNTPVVNAPTVTQPTCALPSGTIVVNATGTGPFEYSINNGASYQPSNTFSMLAPAQYNIRVRAVSHPDCFAAYSGNPVVINAAPNSTTSAISGANTVCPNQTGMAYSVTNTPGSTYAWTITGGTQATGTNTNSITVNWGAAGPGNVRVVETNTALCVGTAVNLPVTIAAGVSAGSLSANVASICQGGSVDISLVGNTGTNGYVVFQNGVVINSLGSIEQVETFLASAAPGEYCLYVFGYLETPKCGNFVGFSLAQVINACFAGQCYDVSQPLCITVNSLTTWYLDADGDGYYVSSTRSCTSPGAGYTTTAGLPGDCNDNPALGGAAINPGATEVCDGIDNNCNGQIDEGGLTTWYKDADNDGYSDGQTLRQCSQPTGYKLAANLTATTGDCNDGNAAINPGAPELCDGLDNNCDGTIDEGVRINCSIVAIPENDVYTGGVATNIYIGYGPQSVTLKPKVSNGNSFTYEWSGAAGLSCTDCEMPVFTATTPGTYTITAKITNELGCSSTCSITICVTDVRVEGSKGTKVWVCFRTLANNYQGTPRASRLEFLYFRISPTSLYSLGKCVEPCATEGGESLITKNMDKKVAEELIDEDVDALTVKVAPNPSAGAFTLSISSNQPEPVKMRVMDISGNVLTSLQHIQPNTTVRTGESLSPGIYLAEIIQNKQRVVIKLMKTR